MPQKSKRKAKAPSTALAVREAPPERSIRQADVLLPMMSKAQMALVLNRTPDYAVKTRQGPGGFYRYIKHGYVTDQLNKIFGFDWDLVVTPMADGQMFALQLEEVQIYKNAKPDHVEVKRHIAVSGYIEARIHDKAGKVKGTLRKSGFGSQLWLPGTEFGDSMKGALSDLVKVCAQRIGVGLDLYWNDEAEANAWEEKQAKKQEQDDQVSKLVSQPPTVFPVLISRAMAEHGVALDEIATIAKQPLEDLMKLDAAHIAKLWKKIQEAHPTVEGEVVR